MTVKRRISYSVPSDIRMIDFGDEISTGGGERKVGLEHEPDLEGSSLVGASGRAFDGADDVVP